MMTSHLRGVKAEALALAFLQEKGFNLLAQRYHMYGGEIDLVMTDGEYLVAFEVRLRKSISCAAESITNIKKQRLTKTLQHFIMHHSQVMEQHPYLRFDVVLVDNDAKICHIENAFGDENE